MLTMYACFLIQRSPRPQIDIDSVNLHSDENLTDINDISGVLKLFFRELPEPLFTHELYHGFIEAARKSDLHGM